MEARSNNRPVISIVVVTLSMLALLTVSTTCLLAYLGIEVPPELSTLTGGLVGALSAMLVKTTPTTSTPGQIQTP